MHSRVPCSEPGAIRDRARRTSRSFKASCATWFPASRRDGVSLTPRSAWFTTANRGGYVAGRSMFGAISRSRDVTGDNVEGDGGHKTTTRAAQGHASTEPIWPPVPKTWDTSADIATVPRGEPPGPQPAGFSSITNGHERGVITTIGEKRPAPAHWVASFPGGIFRRWQAHPGLLCAGDACPMFMRHALRG